MHKGHALSRFELRAHVSHAADVAYVEHIVIKVKVHVVAVGLQARSSRPLRDIIQHLTLMHPHNNTLPLGKLSKTTV